MCLGDLINCISVDMYVVMKHVCLFFTDYNSRKLGSPALVWLQMMRKLYYAVSHVYKCIGSPIYVYVWCDNMRVYLAVDY